MTEKIVLSIVVPVYNGNLFVDRCVTTILREYRSGIELLLVDDGSEDDSFKRCGEWSTSHNWIRVLHHENHGVSYTRNRGIEEARGKYIWFVDVDDVILQNSIVSILKIVENEKPDILLFGYRSRLARKQLNEFDTIPSKPGRYLLENDISDPFWDLQGRNLIHNIGNKVYLTEMLQRNGLKFETGLAIYEDALFCVNALRKARDLLVYQHIGYCYYLEDNRKSLNHGYRKNYYAGVSFLYGSIAKLLGKKDQQYYINFLSAVSDTVENEFRKGRYGYAEFRRYVQETLDKGPVREALVKVEDEKKLDVKWKLLLKRRYHQCYFLFWFAYRKKIFFNCKIMDDVFDLLYYIYKKGQVWRKK